MAEAHKKLLLVEDEPIIALELKETLEERGFSVLEIVESADAVMDAFLRLKPDLVIMDIQLRSYVDGIDSARRLGMLESCPIVFLTANEDPDTEARAKSLPNSYYVRKPYDEDRLVELIDDVLG